MDFEWDIMCCGIDSIFKSQNLIPTTSTILSTPETRENPPDSKEQIGELAMVGTLAASLAVGRFMDS